MNLFKTAALSLFAAASVKAQGVCVDLLENGDFETGDFTGWTVVNSGSCNTVINAGAFDPTGPGGVTAPIEGLFDALTYQGGPGLCSLSQTVAIPSGIIVSATLSWKDRIRNWASVFSDPNQEARVMVNIDDGNGLHEIWSTDPGDPRFQGLVTPNAESYDVTSFVRSAQAMTVQLDEQDNLFFSNVNWDVVSLEVCSIACVCDDDWKNHGQYVSCVAQGAEDLVGIAITEEEKDAIVAAAGESECGKPNQRRLRG